MLTAPRRYGQQTGPVYNLKGLLAPVIASNANHFPPHSQFDTQAHAQNK
jgi:hypothetical protein